MDIGGSDNRLARGKLERMKQLRAVILAESRDPQEPKDSSEGPAVVMEDGKLTVTRQIRLDAHDLKPHQGWRTIDPGSCIDPSGPAAGDEIRVHHQSDIMSAGEDFRVVGAGWMGIGNGLLTVSYAVEQTLGTQRGELTFSLEGETRKQTGPGLESDFLLAPVARLHSDQSHDRVQAEVEKLTRPASSSGIGSDEGNVYVGTSRLRKRS